MTVQEDRWERSPSIPARKTQVGHISSLYFCLHLIHDIVCWQLWKDVFEKNVVVD